MVKNSLPNTLRGYALFENRKIETIRQSKFAAGDENDFVEWAKEKLKETRKEE